MEQIDVDKHDIEYRAEYNLQNRESNEHET